MSRRYVSFSDARRRTSQGGLPRDLFVRRPQPGEWVSLRVMRGEDVLLTALGALRRLSPLEPGERGWLDMMRYVIEIEAQPDYGARGLCHAPTR